MLCSKPTRAEQEATLQKLREEWESRQLEEEESLQRKQQLALEEMKLAAEEAQQKEMSRLEQEKEEFLSQLRGRLDREKKKVRSLLQAVPRVFLLAWGRAVPSVGVKSHLRCFSDSSLRAARAVPACWRHGEVGRRAPPVVITMVIN